MSETHAAREKLAGSGVEAGDRPKESWQELLPGEGEGAGQWSLEAERALGKWSRERKKAREKLGEPRRESWLASKLKSLFRVRGA
jgi:hypothetical protein